MPTFEIYRPEAHETAVFELWQRTLGAHWPLTPDLLRIVLTGAPFYRAGDHFIAREDGHVVGFISTQLYRGEALPHDRSHITALVVAPEHQRQGLGRALLDTALDHLRQIGARRVQLGGGLPRFWPGIPANLMETKPFFEKCGWIFNHKTQYDLVQDMHNYESSPDVYERVKAEGLTIEVATPADMPDIYSFEMREFPPWHAEYQYAERLGDTRDVLVVRRGHEVVGTLIMLTPESSPERGDIIWKTVLGEDVGTLAAVGIAESQQGKGIGLAMIARGAELLRERGVGNCHIGWTEAVHFYQRIGFALWQEYAMSWRDLV
jgi:beta-N-acetylhexosaminidase